MTRHWKATTEVTGPTDDVVRLYTRETASRPRDAMLTVLEDEGDGVEEGTNATALITYTEALQLVQGLVDYFEMTDFHVQLPREDDDL